MDSTAVNKYLLEVLGIDKREMSCVANSLRWEASYKVATHDYEFYSTVEHDSTIFHMARIFAELPGYRHLNSVLNLMARDGYDFSPKDCWTQEGCRNGIRKERRGSPLDVLEYCHPTPFGVELVDNLVGNGLSNFRFYMAGPNKSMNYFVYMLVKSSYSDLPEDLERFRYATRALLQNLVALGMHFYFGNGAVDMTQDYNTFNYEPPKEKTYNELKQYLVESRKQPLTLQASARNSTRRAVGGVCFRKRVAELPLPPPMKKFVLANIALEAEGGSNVSDTVVNNT